MRRFCVSKMSTNMRMHVHIYMYFHYSSETKEEACIKQHARRHQARKLIMESTRWRSCVDLQRYMDSLLQFAGYLDTPLRMSTRSYISSEEVFSSFNNSDSRPSNFLFQIARGSGATLSECTFFKKAHITKKTSSR